MCNEPRSERKPEKASAAGTANNEVITGFTAKIHGDLSAPSAEKTLP
jgi:hypothetical protein